MDTAMFGYARSAPMPEAEAIHALLPGEVLIVEDAGHYPHVDKPEIVA